jgi:2'-5' RNA ligase
MATSSAPVLIATLKIDNRSSEIYNGLRKEHFPAAVNLIDAHITLFHHLPDVPLVTESIQSLCSKQSPFPIEVGHPYSLGRGVAFRVVSPELQSLHTAMSGAFYAFLTPQDRQSFRPHITIQNQVSPEDARQLLLSLTTLSTTRAMAQGVSVWQYLGGPWRHVKDFSFDGA